MPGSGRPQTQRRKYQTPKRILRVEEIRKWEKEVVCSNWNENSFGPKPLTPPKRKRLVDSVCELGTIPRLKWDDCDNLSTSKQWATCESRCKSVIKGLWCLARLWEYSIADAKAKGLHRNKESFHFIFKPLQYSLFPLGEDDSKQTKIRLTDTN